MTDRSIFHVGGLNLRPAKRAAPLRCADDEPRTRTVTDPNGHARRIAFEDERLIWVQEPDGSRTHYLYDDSDQLIARIDALGFSTRYTYDDARRLKGVTFPDGATLDAAYDGQGRLIRHVLPNHDTTRFEYAADRLARVEFSADDVITLAYDARG